MPSTAIADQSYDAGRKRLTVTFVTSRVYEYYDVPAHVAATFRFTTSKGAFFNSRIRDQYDYREITPAQAKRSAR